jgi:uncharacterized repeat protein (TIGR02543 family)
LLIIGNNEINVMDAFIQPFTERNDPMKSLHSFFKAGILCAVLVASAVAQITQSLPYKTVEVANVNGTAVFSGDSPLNDPGRPQLPAYGVTFLLPPGTDPTRVSVSITNATETDVSGSFYVPPGNPITDGKTVKWPSGRVIVNGEDTAVYRANTYYPNRTLGAVSFGAFREYQLVEVTVNPYRYNPVTKSLKKLTGGAIVVSGVSAAVMPKSSMAASTQTNLTSSNEPQKMVSNFIANRDQLSSYVGAVASASPSTLQATSQGAATIASGDPTKTQTYAIITSQDIINNSTQLQNFINFKASQGYNVVTQTFPGVKGAAAATAIRNWLKANYQSANLNIFYALLIGNPTTDSTVPMKMAQVDSTDSTRSLPTDYYYAELSGTWDLNNDGKEGELPQDKGVGGIDKYAEVAVGRIPYYGNIADLDKILAKTITFESSPIANNAWRRNVLLPEVHADNFTPGWDFGEAIKNNVIAPYQYRYHRIYKDFSEDGVYFPEITTITNPQVETFPCSDDSVTKIWKNNPFGLVLWFTHGSSTGASYIMSSYSVPQLNDNFPAFTFQASCSNATPEDSNNLAYSLLRNGAIATIAATRVSAKIGGAFSNKDTYDNPCNVYRFANIFLRAPNPYYWAFYASVGWALDEARYEITDPELGQVMNYNIYGDPSATLNADTLISLPGRIEAEGFKIGGEGVAYHDADADNLGGQFKPFDNVDIYTCTDVNGGYYVGSIQAGEWLAYDVSIAQSGYYDITARVAPTTTGSKTVTITGFGSPLTFTINGTPNVWYDIPLDSIYLTAGTHPVKIGFSAGGFNLNYVDVTPHVSKHNIAPIAMAAAKELEVNRGDMVTLNGSGSYDPDNFPQSLTYSWAQCTGPTVTLTGANTANAVFTAPEAGKYLFRLMVSDGLATYAAYTTVWVKTTIPGRLEAENYDIGGEGAGYHDLSKGNSYLWQVYRIDDVDLFDPTIDKIKQIVVGNTEAGEWLNYSVNVATSGYYDISMHVAAEDNLPKTILMTGLTPTSITFNFATPAGGDNWIYQNMRVYLSAGSYTMTLRMQTGKVKIDYLDFMPIVDVPGRLEAENYNTSGYSDATPGNGGSKYRNDDVDIYYNNGASGLYYVGWTDPDETLNYSFVVGQDGYYSLTAHVASGVAGTKTIQVEGLHHATYQLSTDHAYGWGVWEDVSLQGCVYLTAGEYQITVRMITGGLDIDYFEISTPLPPIANAGPDQFSTPNTTVTLDGSGSRDPDGWPNGGQIYLNWRQMSGEPVTISDPSIANPTFSAAHAGSYVFKLMVSDGEATSIAVTTVTIGTQLPGRIQAEDYDGGGEGSGYHDLTSGNAGNKYRTDDVDIESCSDVNGGYDVYSFDQDEWMAYTVNIPRTGKYSITARMASNVAGTKSIYVYCGNIDLQHPPLASFTFTDASGAWQDVAAIPVYGPTDPPEMDLGAGITTFYFRTVTGGIKVNSFTFSDLTPPTNFAATALSGGDVNLTWDYGSWNNSGFYIERSPENGVSFTQIADVTGSYLRAWIDNTGLSPNTTYKYRIRAYNSSCTSPYSAVVTVKTLTTPATPSNLTASATSATQISLTWKNNATNATGVYIEKSIDGNYFTAVTSVAATATSYNVTGLSENKDYYFRLYAKGASGNSPYSETAFTRTLLATPTNLTATAVSTTEIDLAWNNTTSADFFITVERADGGSSSFSALPQTYELNPTTYKDVGLTLGTSYTYRVYAAPTYYYNNSAVSNTATASTQSYTITATAGANGSISPSGAVTVFKGQSKTFTFTPSANYVVDAVTVDGGAVTPTNNSYTIANVTANHTIAATFKVNAGLTKQTVSASAASSALTASTLAHDGNTGTRWESTQGVDPQWIRFDMGSAKAITVMVLDWETASAKDYRIDGSNDAAFGTFTTLVTKTGMASKQHRIDSLTGLTGSYRYYRMYGTARSTQWGYSIWEARLYTGSSTTMYTLTTASSPVAGGSVSGGGSYASGTVVTVTATPATGYNFTSWSGDLTGTTNPSSITMNANKSVTANFTLKTFTVTPSSGANGSISPAATQTVNYGASITFTFTPAANYVVNTVTLDGASVTPTNNAYTITNVTANHTIAVTFKQATTTYTLTTAASPTAGGTVTGGGSYASGTVVTVTATPATGYNFTSWSGDLTGTANPSSITMSANKSVTANFTLKTFTVTPSAGANGSISPAATQTVNYGASITFTFTPAANYAVNTVTLDGAAVTPTNNAYTITNVTANHTIAVTFKVSAGDAKLKITGVTSGVPQVGNEAVKSYDSNTTTRFCGNTNDLTNAWIQYDFGSVKKVSKVRMLWYNGVTRTYKIKIEVGGVQVWSGTTAKLAAGTYWEQSFTPTSGQTVKITETAVNSDNSYWFSMYETEAWGQ